REVALLLLFALLAFGKIDHLHRHLHLDPHRPEAGPARERERRRNAAAHIDLVAMAGELELDRPRRLLRVAPRAGERLAEQLPPERLATDQPLLGYVLDFIAQITTRRARGKL